MKTNVDTQVAIIQTKLDDIKSEISEVKQSVKEIGSQYVSRTEVEKKIVAFEDKFLERIKRMEIIVYGMIGLILVGFMGALIALVFKK